METWRKIEDYDNYSVSDLGHIRNDKTGIIKKLVMRNGYYSVLLYDNGNRKNVNIHRIVANAFIINPDNKPIVDHIDGNKLNNNKTNLRWASCSENGMNQKICSINTSGIKGVYWEKLNNKWRARIKIDGINIHLGYYDTLEEAKNARQIRANQAFGVFVNACEKL